MAFSLTPAAREDNNSSRLGTAKVSLHKLQTALGPCTGDICDKVRYTWCFHTDYGVAAIRDYRGSYIINEFSIAADSIKAAEQLCVALRKIGIDAQMDDDLVAARGGTPVSNKKPEVPRIPLSGKAAHKHYPKEIVEYRVCADADGEDYVNFVFKDGSRGSALSVKDFLDAWSII